MATTLVTLDCKVFQMMPYIIVPKVRTFHQPSASCFSTARHKPVGGRGHSVCNNLGYYWIVKYFKGKKGGNNYNRKEGCPKITVSLNVSLK